jgi:tetratricopeptide (TPR) repeat protein
VLDWLLPSKVVKLTGMVHAPEPASRGAGITASLVESSSGKVFDTITIWQKDFDTAGATAQAGSQSSDEKGDAMAYSRLAEMAAIWAQFRINNTWPPDYLKKRQKASAGRGTQGATYTRLGTDSWESYALFRMGVRAALSDDAEGARQLYYRALDKDDKNRGALFNLGAIEIAWHNYDIAIDLLCRARESSEREAGFHSQEIAGGIVLEMAWYNTMYQLAAVHSYKGEDDPTCQTKALEYVSELVDTLQRTLAFLQQNTTPKARRDAIWNSERERFEEYHQMVDMGRLEKALVDFREGCLLAKAVILVLSDRFEEAEKLYRDQVEGHGKGYEPITLYNLACYYSQVGEAKRRNSAASATPGTAKTVGATSNNGKVDTSVQRDDGREELEAALRNLEASFEIEARKSDLDWAIQDPSLKGVRTDKDTFERFLTIIGKYAGRVDNGMPLSVVADIGRYYATLLKEEGINSPIQLLRHTITEAARKELADKVGVSQASLQKWISLSEMMVALDIEAPMANLLEVAEVGSLGLLKDASAEELSRRMQERNAGEFYVKKQLLPSAASIAYWTKIARLIDDRALSLEAAHAKAAKDAVPHGVHGLIKSLVHIFAGGTAGNVGQGTSNGGKAQDSAGENKPGLTEVQ